MASGKWAAGVPHTFGSVKHPRNGNRHRLVRRHLKAGPAGVGEEASLRPRRSKPPPARRTVVLLCRTMTPSGDASSLSTALFEAARAVGANVHSAGAALGERASSPAEAVRAASRSEGRSAVVLLPEELGEAIAAIARSVAAPRPDRGPCRLRAPGRSRRDRAALRDRRRARVHVVPGGRGARGRGAPSRRARQRGAVRPPLRRAVRGRAPSAALRRGARGDPRPVPPARFAPEGR